MSLIPADLLTDQDLLALDAEAATEFGSSPLGEKRRVAVTQWLRPRLETAGFKVALHKTRRVPDACYQRVGGAYADLRDAFATRAADVNLADVFVDPTQDALFVGMGAPFRGLFAVLTDTVNAQAVAASITYWNGKWSALSSIVDGTQAVEGQAFSGGGRITWQLPDDWFERTLGPADSSTPAYWVRVQVNTAVTNPTLLTQLLPLAFSRLTNPCALHALYLLYREAMGTARGGETWAKKAEMFEQAAAGELELVIPQLADEFDIDNSGAVDPAEVSSVTNIEQMTTWERG